MVINVEFWKKKKVFITGHTGFKGGWLAFWLQILGAEVIGYALTPPSKPNLFSIAHIQNDMVHLLGDIRDNEKLLSAIKSTRPDIVFHLAAQSLVRNSYQNPVETYSTNVMGTVNLFEAIRQTDSVRAVVNVTTDKCYENKEWLWAYRENDQLGGHDPYSNSKACSELITKAYRSSFFTDDERVRLASARAGNVIGGGDWAEDRLIPDLVRAMLNRRPLHLRYPHAIRPWQYVLNPLSGYLLLAEKLYSGSNSYADAWNFGPNESDDRTVSWVANRISTLLDKNIEIFSMETDAQPHEANYLRLDCAKVQSKLGWKPIWNLEKGLKETAQWYLAYKDNQDMRDFTLKQINDFITSLMRENI